MNKTKGYNYLIRIINKFVDVENRHFFYDCDLPTLFDPEEQYYVMLIRKNGTYLLPKSKAPYDTQLYEFSKKYDYGFYEIDTKTLMPTYIEDIKQYIDMSSQTNELKKQYGYLADLDDYDDYEY